MVEIRGVEPLTFSMPSCDDARTARDGKRQMRILLDFCVTTDLLTINETVCSC